MRDDWERDLARLVELLVVFNLMSMGISMGISTSEEIVVFVRSVGSAARVTWTGSMVDDDDDVDGELDDGSEERCCFLSPGVSFIASM